MHQRRPSTSALSVLACAPAAGAPALAGSSPVAASHAGEYAQVSPIFSQLVAFSTPERLVTGDEQGAGRFYIRELVPRGETVNRWTEMITVTGLQGAATAPNLTPLRDLQIIASSFARTRPDTFNTLQLGRLRIGTYDAEAAVLSCGTNLQLRSPSSESADRFLARPARPRLTAVGHPRRTVQRRTCAAQSPMTQATRPAATHQGVLPGRGRHRGQPGLPARQSGTLSAAPLGWRFPPRSR